MSIYISPTTGNSYLNAYVQSGSGINTAVIKFDPSDNQVWAQYYANQNTIRHEFTVDSTETYIYLADSDHQGIKI
jgi:hypothetical protein